jgi:DNA-binding response OmpR family regulator
MLSVRGDESIKSGPGAGADDYLSKPFGMWSCRRVADRRS